MENSQLREVMIYQLGAFDRSGATIDENTVHATILTDQGTGTATPKRIYKAFVRATLAANGHDDPPWPLDWMNRSVADLADVLLPPTGGDA